MAILPDSSPLAVTAAASWTPELSSSPHAATPSASAATSAAQEAS